MELKSNQKRKMKKKEIKWQLIAVGIICIAILEILALIKGIDGILLTAVIGVIAAAIGIIIPNPINVR